MALLTRRVPLIKKRTVKSLADQLEAQASNEEFSLIGIITLITYVLFFMYIYFTTWMKGYMTNLFDFTLANSLEHCEKTLSTLLIMSYIGLYTSFMINKGFLSNQVNTRTLVVLFNVSIATGFLILFITPVGDQERIHMFISVLMAVTAVANTYLISDVYNTTFLPDPLTDSLSGLSIALTVLLIIIMIFVGVRVYRGITFKLLGVLEVGMLICFGAVLGVLTFMPKMPDTKRECIIKSDRQ